MLRFRPHHFLCTLCHRGKGYSEDFKKGYASVMERLGRPETGDAERIEVVGGPDTICGFCPKMDGVVCESQDKVDLLDEAHGRILGLVEGQCLTWAVAKRQLAERMTLEAFEDACSPCGWKPLGLCREILESFRARRS